MQNGLMVLHSNRLETLTELVADWLERQPLAPLETETFLVQSNGMAQWLNCNWRMRWGSGRLPVPDAGPFSVERLPRRARRGQGAAHLTLRQVPFAVAIVSLAADSAG